jgi:hypothetical protein
MIVYGPGPEEARESIFAQISWPLWLLLIASFAVMVGTRAYVRHVERDLVSPPRRAPAVEMISPDRAVRAGDLHLSWQSVEGASAYRLHVTSITGGIIVDGLCITETDWFAPEDALPALVPGEYRWSVDALDESGEPFRRSAQESFRIQ